MRVIEATSDSAKREQIVVLAATTLAQALCSAAMLLVPTLAPQLAQNLDLPIALIGVQMSLLYGVAMLVSAQAGTWVQQVGGCRITQYSMLLVVVGCALIARSSVSLLILGTVALGFAYGLTNPAAAHLLTRFTPARRRNLVFSIKQTGVPLGGVIAGVCAPPLAYWFGWQFAFVGLATIAAAIGLALQPRRAGWDDDRRSHHRRSGLASMQILRKSRATLWLGLMGCCLAAGQLSFLTYLVTMMVEELLITLMVAGVIMSAVHVAGVVGRIAWGAIADRVGSSLGVLAGLVCVMTILFLAVATIESSSPRWFLLLVFVGLGSTVVGWNGVYLAAVAQRSAHANVSDATGAVLVLTYLGVLVGPSLFALVFSLTGSFAATFILPACFSVLALACLVMCKQSARKEHDQARI